MPKIRTIKPELYRHIELFDAEQACGLPLRLAFTGLFTCADREGRFKWQPRALKLDVLPFDNINFAAVLDALAEAGFILKYTVKETTYGVIPSWHEHQRINPHEPQSKLPHHLATVACPSAPVEASCAHSENFTTPLTVVTPVTLTQEPPLQQETLRKEQTLATLRPLPIRTQPVITTPTPVQTVFEHWKTTFQHPHALLDDKRQQLIQKALKQGYSVKNLCDAISGCSQTPYNCGHNQQGQRYDGLHIILRDADQIERFMHHSDHPPQEPHHRKLQANALAAEHWLQQASQEVTS